MSWPFPGSCISFAGGLVQTAPGASTWVGRELASPGAPLLWHRGALEQLWGVTRESPLQQAEHTERPGLCPAM